MRDRHGYSYTCRNDCCYVEVIPVAATQARKNPPWVVVYDGLHGTFASHAERLGKTAQVMRDRASARACWKIKDKNYQPPPSVDKVTAEIKAVANRFLRLPRVVA